MSDTEDNVALATGNIVGTDNVPYKGSWGCLSPQKCHACQAAAAEAKYLYLGNHDGSIPEDTQTIGMFADSGSEYLIDVAIPDSVVSVEEYAFSNCKNLTTVTIPSSVKIIGEYAFFGCDKLTEVTISRNTTVCKNTFDNCTIIWT
jgi:hypothetical protein